MPLSANRIWRQLPIEIRVAACQVLWNESPSAQKHLLFATLAKTKNLREVTVRKSPVERLVNWTAATLTLPDPILDDILKEYLLHAHRAVIIRFLDLLKIPHAEGMIEESFDYTTLQGECVEAAARSLLSDEDRAGAELYLKYLVLQGGPWEPIAELFPEAE